MVAPLVGAWIEIMLRHEYHPVRRVAPLVGAWIEILYCVSPDHLDQSLPSWERGLKSPAHANGQVALGRSPRGSVD